LLANAPGLLWRSLDRLLREAAEPAELDAVVSAAAAAIPAVSGRVLLSVREHLVNRQVPTDVSRVFANRNGRAWTEPETRQPLDEPAVSALTTAIDAEITQRLPDYGTILIDPAVLGAPATRSTPVTSPRLRRERASSSTYRWRTRRARSSSRR
jgi:hypothetical protein